MNNYKNYSIFRRWIRDEKLIGYSVMCIGFVVWDCLYRLNLLLRLNGIILSGIIRTLNVKKAIRMDRQI